jgi:hypothetical protein
MVLRNVRIFNCYTLHKCKRIPSFDQLPLWKPENLYLMLCFDIRISGAFIAEIILWSGRAPSLFVIFALACENRRSFWNCLLHSLVGLWCFHIWLVQYYAFCPCKQRQRVHFWGGGTHRTGFVISLIWWPREWWLAEGPCSFTLSSKLAQQLWLVFLTYLTFQLW